LSILYTTPLVARLASRPQLPAFVIRLYGDGSGDPHPFAAARARSDLRQLLKPVEDKTS